MNCVFYCIKYLYAIFMSSAEHKHEYIPLQKYWNSKANSFVFAIYWIHLGLWWKKNMNTRQQFWISAFTSWYLHLHYIICHLADAFIQSDLQLIRQSRRHTPWSNVGLRALLKGPTAVQILSWPHQRSSHQPCRSKSSSLTTMLQAAHT